MADLRESIRLELFSLSGSPPKDQDRGRRLANVAVKQTTLYKKTKAIGDLEQAVDLFRAAVDATPIHHVCRPKRLHNLALNLGKLYRQSKSASYLVEAVDIGREAVTTLSQDNAARATYLSDLGVAIWDRYQTTDSIDHLREFIQINKEALEICTRNHPYRSKVMNDVGVGLGEQYIKTGSEQDLQDAIAFGQASVCDSSEGHPNQARHLANFSVALGDRYLITGSKDDLEYSIFYARTAVDKARPDDREVGRYLNNLAIRYLERYTRVKSSVDWQAALDSGNAAVAVLYSTDSERAIYLDNLAMCYHSRYKELGTSDLLEQAVNHTRAAMRESRLSQDHTHQAKRSFNLGTTLGIRYENSGQFDDLQQSINHIETALNGCPEGYPERARYVHDLGVGYYDKFQKQQDLYDLRLARRYFLDCLRQPNAIPLQRLRGGRKAAKIAIEQQEWQQATVYLSECIALVPRISLRSNAHDDLHHVLQQLSGLGSLAAWVYLRAGKSVVESLQALEQCRGIISNIIMDSRSDISSLAEAYPDIAANYNGLREAVARYGLFNETGSLSSEKNDYVSKSLKLAQNLKKLEDLEAEIRELPGFDRFQLPPAEDEMLFLSKQGPIVSVNITPYGCHAFLIAKDCIRQIELVSVTPSDLEKHISWRVLEGEPSIRNFKNISGSSQINQDSNAHQDSSMTSTAIESMRWLWEAIVQPILAEMGLLWETVAPTSLPCMWWVSSGAVALLPFHAAGNPGIDSTENTLSHVCSSYIPTIKMLYHSRKMQSAPRLVDKILVVTMPTTPARPGTHHDPLDVDDEVTAITRYFGNPNSIEILPNPEPCRVLERLPECSIVHFACHGRTNLQDPSQSALLLGKTVPADLTAENIRTLDHNSAQIAYLSACSTAKLGGNRLTDEVIHLASTFQLAGFRNVIGALWEVDDYAAGKVAAKFYKYLLSQSLGSTCRVPRALHRAIIDLKQDGGNDIEDFLWAPFVHFGP